MPGAPDGSHVVLSTIVIVSPVNLRAKSGTWSVGMTRRTCDVPATASTSTECSRAPVSRHRVSR